MQNEESLLLRKDRDDEVMRQIWEFITEAVR